MSWLELDRETGFEMLPFKRFERFELCYGGDSLPATWRGRFSVTRLNDPRYNPC